MGQGGASNGFDRRPRRLAAARGTAPWSPLAGVVAEVVHVRVGDAATSDIVAAIRESVWRADANALAAESTAQEGPLLLRASVLGPNSVRTER